MLLHRRVGALASKAGVVRGCIATDRQPNCALMFFWAAAITLLHQNCLYLYDDVMISCKFNIHSYFTWLPWYWSTAMIHAPYSRCQIMSLLWLPDSPGSDQSPFSVRYFPGLIFGSRLSPRLSCWVCVCMYVCMYNATFSLKTQDTSNAGFTCD